MHSMLVYFKFPVRLCVSVQPSSQVRLDACLPSTLRSKHTTPYFGRITKTIFMICLVIKQFDNDSYCIYQAVSKTTTTG